jgi:hypothetical protein
MTDKKIFPLSHVVLYAKGWYKTTDNVWDDLLEIIKIDDYTPFDRGDVYNIIVSRFSEFDSHETNLRNVLFSISENNCWKVGYYTKGNVEWSSRPKEELPDYDMQTAVIYHILSTLRFIEVTKYNLVVPKYKKYPKHPERTLKDVIEVFSRLKRKKTLVVSN